MFSNMQRIWLSISNKYPLENVERITPNIYNLDIRGYLFLYTRNSFYSRPKSLVGLLIRYKIVCSFEIPP